jgi:hypothetical protein
MQAAARVLAILNSRCISLPAGKMLFCGGKSAFPSASEAVQINHLCSISADASCSGIAAELQGIIEGSLKSPVRRRPPAARRDFIEA